MSSELLKKGECTMNILITGGAGYIGSHTAVELLNAGYEFNYHILAEESK